MHSFEYLIKEVEDKLSAVQNALSVCKAEKALLNNNLNSAKEAVDESFKRHIGTLQCRSKWLVCHADSIFHLKEGSLTQQISDLELISNELKSCVEASDCSLNKPEEIRMMASTVLQNSANYLIQPCENGSMIFASNDNKLEEMIIGFGDIDVNSKSDKSFDYDLLMDEGVFVVETSPKKQDSIEMKVKSIEMHHLTAQSANSEKSLEIVEIELRPVSGVNSTSTGSLSLTDSAYEEGTMSKSLDEWLYRPDSMNEVQSEKTFDVNTSDQVEMEAKSDKVPLWLINCEETKPCNRESQSVPEPKKKFVSMLDAPAVNSSLWLKENQLIDRGFLYKPQTSTRLQGDRSSTSGTSANIEHFDTILNAPDSRFLQHRDVDMDSDMNSLQYTMNYLVLGDKLSWTISDSRSEVNDSTNTNHLNRIVEAPHSNFLSGRDKYSKDRTKSQTPINFNVAVDHMRMIENQPNTKFLLRPHKSFDPSMCEWLRGQSADRCAQCFDDCGYSKFDEKWINTATDW